MIADNKNQTKPENVATCGHCGLSWDDGTSTTYTPAPAGRCPFEQWHQENGHTSPRLIPEDFEVKPFIVCEQCDKVCKPAKHTDGYRLQGDKTICFDCCGVLDREEMNKTGRAVLYLSVESQNVGPEPGRRLFSGKVSNWPGTLSFKVTGTCGRHNIAGRRYDVWFTDENGREWHGVTYGDWTQLCHCKRTKGPKPLRVRVRMTDLQWHGDGWSENGAAVDERVIEMKENVTDRGAARIIMQELGVSGYRKEQWCQSDFGPWRNGTIGIYADIVQD